MSWNLLQCSTTQGRVAQREPNTQTHPHAHTSPIVCSGAETLNERTAPLEQPVLRATIGSDFSRETQRTWHVLFVDLIFSSWRQLDCTALAASDRSEQKFALGFFWSPHSRCDTCDRTRVRWFGFPTHNTVQYSYKSGFLALHLLRTKKITKVKLHSTHTYE